MRISSSKPLSQPQETMLLCSLSAYKDRASRTEDHACVQKMIMNQCRSRSEVWGLGCGKLDVHNMLFAQCYSGKVLQIFWGSLKIYTYLFTAFVTARVEHY
jgi:hypothetical protein